MISRRGQMSHGGQNCPQFENYWSIVGCRGSNPGAHAYYLWGLGHITYLSDISLSICKKDIQTTLTVTLLPRKIVERVRQLMHAELSEQCLELKAKEVSAVRIACLTLLPSLSPSLTQTHHSRSKPCETSLLSFTNLDLLSPLVLSLYCLRAREMLSPEFQKRQWERKWEECELNPQRVHIWEVFSVPKDLIFSFSWKGALINSPSARWSHTSSLQSHPPQPCVLVSCLSLSLSYTHIHTNTHT